MKTDIAIIGAGPAGLAFAQALRGQGLRVLLLERAPAAAIAEPGYDGREIALTHRSQAILAELDAWDRIPAAGTAPLREARVIDGGSPLALRFAPDGPAGEPLGRLVPNHLIRRALHQAVTAAGEAEILAGRQVTGLALDPAEARLLLEDGTVVRAGLVVAADSRFSSAREMAGIGASRTDFRRTMIVCRMAHALPHQAAATEWFGHGQTIAMLPLQGDHSSAVITLPHDTAASLMAMAEDEFGAEVTRRYEGRLGAMTLAGTRHAYPLVGVYAHSFMARRFALMGDAAVGMHPVTAHGFNFGLSGAVRLAREIARAGAAGAPVGDGGALARYAMGHRRETLGLYLATNAVARLYGEETRPARLLRKALIGAGAALPPVRRAIVARLMDATRAAPVSAG